MTLEAIANELNGPEMNDAARGPLVSILGADLLRRL